MIEVVVMAVVVVVALGIVVVGTGERGVKTRYLQYNNHDLRNFPRITAKVKSHWIEFREGLRI